MSYNHLDIDKKWQAAWAKDQCFRAEIDPKKPKYYALDMFPYPSGLGLHVGHLASYTPTDLISRYKRTRGFNVLHPMGWDAFGLPAEQYAIQTGVHPAVTTQKASDNFRRQLQSFGFSFDWNREISTADKNFYKWTQFIFLKLWEKGLAYQKEVPVNWCPALKTVLANEEVIDGKSERGGHPVIRKPMRQWMLKITDYAERLLSGLDKIDWPEKTKEGQRNWIGKSEGAEVEFTIDGHPEKLTVFTTRPDTLFGVSFMVMAPEHPLVTKISTNQQAVVKYVEDTAKKSEVDRKAAVEKTGVATGAFAINPFTHQKIPIWISDYVLLDYGSGAIMAVPGHDERDFEFATKFGLPIHRVLEGGDLPFTGEGKLVNSDFLNGLTKTEGIAKAISEVEKRNIGKKVVQYKLRDWLFSRQRYWGEPFPMIRLKDGTLQGVPVSELPVELPPVADYEPTESGEPPLARVEKFRNYERKDAFQKPFAVLKPTKQRSHNDDTDLVPMIGFVQNDNEIFGLGNYLVGNPYDSEIDELKGAQRETDTMPGSAGSSWYFLRYIDPHNNKAPFSKEAEKYWMPVDLYLGGAEHTVGHLLYARFWQKVLFDAGLVTQDEPFQKLFHQGLILGPDNQKMSKSRGNVINPDEVRDQFGADAARMYICFMGPPDRDKPWATNGIEGVRRFLDRVWRLAFDENGNVIANDQPLPPETEKLLHKTIKKVTHDIETMSFNTAVSAMMILVNDLYKVDGKSKSTLRTLSQLLMPFAPHFAEEMWSQLGGTGYVSLAKWPEFDPGLVVDDVATIGVQVNGKMRGTVELALTADESQAMAAAMALETVKSVVGDKTPKKMIYKAGKIINLIV